MRWTRLVAVVVAMLGVATAATPSDGDVCKSVCSCKVSKVDCTCNNQVTDLILTQETLRSMHEDRDVVKAFEVKNCALVDFQENSFKGMNDLEHVIVNNVNTTTFAMGAFEIFQSLRINKVKSLNFQESALQGARGIHSIHIQNSNISNIPSWAFFKIEDLREFHLENVRIGNIATNAIELRMNQARSDIKILNCKITNMKQNAITINDTINFVVNNSEVERAAEGSVNLAFQNIADITGNIFKGDVNIHLFNAYTNHSKHFGNLHFENNTIDALGAEAIQHYPPNERPRTPHGLADWVAIGRDNKVNCRCSDNASASEEYFKNNLCTRACKSLSISKFLQSCAKDKTLNVQERIKKLCVNEPEFISTLPPKPTAQPTKGSGAATTNSKDFVTGISVYLAIVLFSAF